MAPFSPASRILVVKIGALGDVLMCAPAVERYAQESGAKVSWIVSKALACVLDKIPCVDEIIEVEESNLFSGGRGRQIQEMLRLWRPIAGRRFDLVATLSMDWRYSILTLPVLARRRIRLRAMPSRQGLIPGRAHSDEYYRILQGRDAPASDRVSHRSYAGHPSVEGELLRSTSRPAIGLCPGGAKNALAEQSLKRWPVERYALLAKKLIDVGCDVVLFGNDGDGWVRPAFNAIKVVDLIGKTSILETIECMSKLDCIVTHDTGPLHLAGCSGSKIVALFGPTMPRQFLPSGSDAMAIWGGEHLSCRPCYDGRRFAPCLDNRCMQAISAEAVFEALSRLVDI